MLFSCLRAFGLRLNCYQKFTKATTGKVQSYWFHFFQLLANQEQSFNNLFPSFEAINKVLKSQGSGVNLHGFQAAKAWKKERSSKGGRPLFRDVSHQVKMWFLKHPGAIHRNLQKFSLYIEGKELKASSNFWWSDVHALPSALAKLCIPESVLWQLLKHRTSVYSKCPPSTAVELSQTATNPRPSHTRALSSSSTPGASGFHPCTEKQSPDLRSSFTQLI